MESSLARIKTNDSKPMYGGDIEKKNINFCCFDWERTETWIIECGYMNVRMHKVVHVEKNWELLHFMRL